MKLVESYLTNNPCYQNNVNKADSRYTSFQKNGPSGLMLHSVGCAQPSASVFIKNWSKSTYSNACVHGFIDGNDGTVYQAMPWNYRAWHCGGDGNNTHVGVEMCEPSTIKYTTGANFTVTDKTAAQASVKKTYEAAVELFAMLCQKYNLNPLTAICSHAEGYKKGIASGHADPEHLWKGVGMSYTMDTFRAAVKAKMAETSGSTAATTTASTATTTTTTGSSSGDCPFKVRVKVTDLNIRKGPGTNYSATGKFTGKGTFTITAVSAGAGSDSGWGKLKSGAGWISLDYATKV